MRSSLQSDVRADTKTRHAMTGRRRSASVAAAVAAAGTLAATGSLAGVWSGAGSAAAAAAVGTRVAISGCSSTRPASCAATELPGTAAGQVPGGPANARSITLTNSSQQLAGAPTLRAGPCVARGVGRYFGADTAGFCGRVDITIGSSGAGVCFFPARPRPCPELSSSDNLARLARAGVVRLGAQLPLGGTRTIVIRTALDVGAGNADQGLRASQALAFTVAGG